MIINGFSAKNVFGYLNFDIKFNSDISFLVGGNGSGKTTALKLMNSLISPNFKDLLQIPFDVCALEINESNEDITIYAESKDNNIYFRVSGIKEELVLPKFNNFKIDLLLHHEDRLEEIIYDLKQKNSDHPVLKAISNIPSPIFLGLDRRRDQSDMRQDYFYEREILLQQRNKRSGGSRRFIKGSIGISLMETEMLVQNTFRRIRELENKQSYKLRDKILMSSFKFSKFVDNDLDHIDIKWKEKEGLLARKKEINDAISNIVGKDSSLSNEVDKFFDEMTSLFGKMSQKKDAFLIEWLLNKAQIERMASIVDIIDDHKSRVDKLNQPIDEFLRTVNSFYNDSGKELDIDAVGQLVVKRQKNNECTIEGLSSGERQLLVIFAHTFFNRPIRNRNSNIFIIDEPELSLHLGWQEKFADTIFSVRPASQFILATHSPEIIAGNKNKAIKCN